MNNKPIITKDILQPSQLLFLISILESINPLIWAGVVGKTDADPSSILNIDGIKECLNKVGGTVLPIKVIDKPRFRTIMIKIIQNSKAVVTKLLSGCKLRSVTVTKADGRLPSTRNGLCWHVDLTKDGSHLITSSYTILIDETEGGHFWISEQDSGEVCESNQSKKTRNIKVASNQMCNFPGSFVKHSVSAVTVGCRYAIVFDWESNDSIINVMKMWTCKQFVCTDCLHSFASEADLSSHIRYIRKTKTKSCISSKYIIYK
jgi:hypothetical protein